jgi:hypothetical protein
MAERTPIPNPWVRAAKRRWPQYTVVPDGEGQGPYALVNGSMMYVRLFGFRMFAEQALNERPDCKFCTLVEIQPDFGFRQVQNWLQADLIERDR